MNVKKLNFITSQTHGIRTKQYARDDNDEGGLSLFGFFVYYEKPISCV